MLLIKETSCGKDISHFMEGGFWSQVYHVTKQNKKHWGTYINGSDNVFSCKKYDHNYVGCIVFVHFKGWLCSTMNLNLTYHVESTSKHSTIVDSSNNGSLNWYHFISTINILPSKEPIHSDNDILANTHSSEHTNTHKHLLITWFSRKIKIQKCSEKCLSQKDTGVLCMVLYL